MTRALLITLLLCAVACDKPAPAPAPVEPTPAPAQDTKPVEEAKPEAAKPAEPPAKPAIDPTTLEGTYILAHKVTPLNGPDQDVEDCLTITSLDDGLAFAFTIHQDGGMSCALDGLAEPAGAGAWMFKQKAEGSGEECALSLKLTDKGLVFNDTNDVCRTIGCGMNGTIIEVEFPLTSRAEGKTCGK
jgi:hypothetical protein